ncbi:hypothetical protein [Amycolatopsis jejuensis]|uniref:hypothetical protein n=1 Tax=Amycolatopsis jejuensis TaxID=330084 RepID=UPI0005265196|nr:hypothetical protein [Amycolatopsis jejuensis]
MSRASTTTSTIVVIVAVMVLGGLLAGAAIIAGHNPAPRSRSPAAAHPRTEPDASSTTRWMRTRPTSPAPSSASSRNAGYRGGRR